MVAAAPPPIVAPLRRGSLPAERPRPFVPVLREGDAVPAYRLLDQRGRAFSFADSGGRATIVSFISTRCTDTCPLVMAKFVRMQGVLRGVPVRLVTMTVDPAVDTPAVLARYGRAYGADPSRWLLVAGPAARIRDLTARFGVATQRARDGTLEHTEAAVVLDRRGRLTKIVDGSTWLPDDLAADGEQAAGASGSPLRAVRTWLAGSASALCGGRGATPLSVGSGLIILAVLLAAVAAAFRRAFRTGPASG